MHSFHCNIYFYHSFAEFDRKNEVKTHNFDYKDLQKYYEKTRNMGNRAILKRRMVIFMNDHKIHRKIEACSHQLENLGPVLLGQLEILISIPFP